MDHCDACGYVYRDRGPTRLAESLRSLGPRYADRLRRASDRALRQRPEPAVWSALEYGCHVRDVLLIERDRLFLALVEDEPAFASLHRDERARLARYASDDPRLVADHVVMAAELVADGFAHVDEAGWRRTCVYTYPVPTTRTVAWLGAHTLHEGEHHLGDIDHVLAAVTDARTI